MRAMMLRLKSPCQFSALPSWLCSARKFIHWTLVAQKEDKEEFPVKRPKQRQPKNKSLQQPEEAGDEGAKSSDESMFKAYGDRYATRAAGEAYGERRGSPNEVNPFDKDVKGDKAEDAGIPELKNRDEVRKSAGIKKVKQGDKKKND